MKMRRLLTVAAGALLAGCLGAHAGESRLLCGFESQADLRMWDFTSGTGRIVAEGATQGEHAMEITFDPKGRYLAGYIYWRRPPRDWSAYDALVLDVTNPLDRPVAGYLLVADQAWVEKGRSYWNRHNRSTTFAPGTTSWTIPVRGLYRGEAGSRNNDIKRNIDPDSIVRVDFAFGKAGTTGRVIVDNLRFAKTGRPEGVWAFDFGPPAQSVMLGWTSVAHDTAYSKDRGYGWGPRGGTPWNGAARDTTFPTMLLQDFCEAGGYNFRIDAPPGRYKLLVFYENSGYWGGEQAKHRWRTIAVNGTEVWREERPDGPAHALYRFEDVEPVGKDIWDTYMAGELAKPVVFEAQAGDAGLNIRCKADVTWGSKLAALACHKVGDEQAAKWLDDQLEALAREFRSKAVCLDKPDTKHPTPGQWAGYDIQAWPVRLEDEVTPYSAMPDDAPSPDRLRLSRVVARGETEALCLGVLSLGARAIPLSFEWSDAARGLPVQILAARYNTNRGFNSIAYRLRAHTLREVRELRRVGPGVGTRLIVLRITVPPDAPPGDYRGEFTLSALRFITTDGVAKHGKQLRIPVEIKVSPATLDRETDYLMGFFGLMPPSLIPKEKRWDVLDETLAMLREYGMNAVSGGPSWSLEGWKDGRPVVDFGQCDRFFALLRKHGFTRPINGYGGLRFRGLHDRYQKGKAGAEAERESGLPYPEALMRAWKAVDAHARQARWPTIYYAMCDETRVRDVAERELAFMTRMAPVSTAFPHTLRTSGSYSVHFNQRPADKDDLLYWHQRFFEVLDVSSLNLHDPSVMAEAKKLGKEIHIYNQGRTRYSFGLYQWSEYRKGVRARWQWHLNILHGYQFFDLDGREPDTAMICYGREAIYPTIHFERCREGAEDFYLYNALWKLIEARRRRGDTSKPVTDAAALLEGAVARVKLNERHKPDWFDPDAFKLQVIDAIERLAAR
ncbi:MAG: hypothetical protein ACLF0G_02120 [Candidatus Brocadiia bacterium]